MTLNDLAMLIQRNATKEDIDSIVTARLNEYQHKTDLKIDAIQNKVETAAEMNTDNTNKIEELQSTVEMLKQDQLRNNICISGVPPDQIIDGNTSDIIIKIANVLGVKIMPNQFSSHPVASKKFIIVNFYNYSHKQQMHIHIRARKSLMVEEVFKSKSNSQIYLNDHLTPYFTKIHLLARNAKKEGKLFTVSSYGGKIRVRKNQNDLPIVIESEKQIQTLIDMECADSSIDSIQLVENATNNEASKQPKTKPTKQTKTNQHTTHLQNSRNSNTKRATKNNSTGQYRQNSARTNTDNRDKRSAKPKRNVNHQRKQN